VLIVVYIGHHQRIRAACGKAISKNSADKNALSWGYAAHDACRKHPETPLP
jgi:hypothetical protein